ncbi:MAG TPA: hypothetical protein VN645_06645 [Steroidobacteraceae bacterium]|nr:hypothetical protein [Steroidobacteraceae bacterium]
MSEMPQHVSLEAQFRAAVPPQQAPLAQRTLWRLLLSLLRLRPIQNYIEKKFRA